MFYEPSEKIFLKTRKLFPHCYFSLLPESKHRLGLVTRRRCRRLQIAGEANFPGVGSCQAKRATFLRRRQPRTPPGDCSAVLSDGFTLRHFFPPSLSSLVDIVPFEDTTIFETNLHPNGPLLLLLSRQTSLPRRRCDFVCSLGIMLGCTNVYKRIVM